MITDMGNVIESLNFFGWIIACYVGWRTYRWNNRSDLDAFTHQIICCLMWVFAGLGLSAFWFAISRFLHAENTHWHLLMFEWRWLVVLTTQAMIGWGALSFVILIDEHGALKKYSVFATAAIIAIGLGFYDSRF